MERIEAKDMEKASYNFGCNYCIKRGEKDDTVWEGEECYKDNICCNKPACIIKYQIEKLKK